MSSGQGTDSEDAVPEVTIIRRIKRKNPSLGAGRKVRRRGKLERLYDAPVEVLLEIFGHLDPVDLLRLARSTKPFRKFLLNPNQKSLWAQCLSNVPGLPPCPSMLSEPAYTAVMFDTHCHFCGVLGVRTVEVELLLRCCSACRKNDDNIYRIGTKHNWWPERPQFLQAEDPLNLLPTFNGRLSEKFTDSGFGTLRTTWDKFVTECKEVEARSKKVNSPEEGDVIIQEFIERQHKMMEGIMKIADAIEIWATARRYNRGDEIRKIREQRYNQVLERLSAMGDGLREEVDNFNRTDRIEFRQLAVGVSTSLVTDRTWKKLKVRLSDFINGVRDKETQHTRAEPYVNILRIITPFLDRWVKTRPLSWTDLLPTITDICLYPPVMECITQSILNPVPKGRVPSSPPMQITSQLISDAASHSMEIITTELASIARSGIRSALNVAVEGDAVLDLACVWFTCKCGYPLPIAYPEVRQHDCMRVSEPPAQLSPFSAEGDLSYALWEETGAYFPSTPEQIQSLIRFNTLTCKTAQQILNFYQRNVHDTTVKQMDQLDPRIACKSCEEIMTWSKVIYHHCSRRLNPGEALELIAVDTTLIERVKAISEKQFSEKHAMVHCVGCRIFHGPALQRYWGLVEKHELKRHMKEAHGITCLQIIEGVHYEKPWENDATVTFQDLARDLDLDYSAPLWSLFAQSTQHSRPMDAADAQVSSEPN